MPTRSDIIAELFEALPQVEDFPLDTQQLWDAFNKATKAKDIKLRKLSQSKKDAEDKGPKQVSGYNLFMQHFYETRQTIPEETSDKKKFLMQMLKEQWSVVKQNPEEHATWEHKATALNESNGFFKKVVLPKKLKPPSYASRIRSWNEQVEIMMTLDDPEQIAAHKAHMKELFPEGKPVKPEKKQKDDELC